MTDQSLLNPVEIPQSPFEQIKRIDIDGSEFWSGRDLVDVLGYANWHRLTPTFQDVYSALCVENSAQADLIPSSKMARIGSGAVREIKDWRLSRYALDKILSRVANQKPEAVRELRLRGKSRLRIETEIGAVLFDFCEQAGLSIVHQYSLGNYRFDFCIAERLLVEVDEMYHEDSLEQKRKDTLKTQIAAQHGFKLLRVPIPFDNIARLCGSIFRLLAEP